MTEVMELDLLVLLITELALLSEKKGFHVAPLSAPAQPQEKWHVTPRLQFIQK